MLWCLLMLLNTFNLSTCLEDFDEVIVEYPKLSVTNGQLSFEANKNGPSAIVLKAAAEERVDIECKKNHNKEQIELINSKKDGINATVIVSTNSTDGLLHTNETHEDSRRANCPTCNCGTSFNKNRIVGGTVAKINEYPWTVYLTHFGKFYCGSSLINTKYLLSAAHCVAGISRLTLKAVFLDEDRSANSRDANKFTRNIVSVIRHPGYSSSTTNNDISLLKLDKEVTFTGILRPVCLPPADNTFAGQKGIVTGWGTTREGGQTSDKLRAVTLPILSNEQCRKTGNGRRITSNMMCAGYVKAGKKDSCQGDSGGPMQVFLNGAYRVVGVVSWGDGCGRPNHPGVYTRVNKYLNWIKSNTKDGCYCEKN